jgi:Protein of unknown function (DUF2442)
MIKVTKVKPIEDFKLELRFSDGTAGVLDCAPIVAEDGPMVKPLRDPRFFARVFLEFGAPTWPNGYDIAPWAAKAEIEAAAGFAGASSTSA